MVFRRQKKGKNSDPEESPAITQFVARPGMLELHDDDEELRVWLPELSKQALDETVACIRLTASRYLREVFMIYLYGVHELTRYPGI